MFFKHHRAINQTMKFGAKLVTITAPRSIVSEQFRTIRTNIGFMGIDQPLKTIAFTSANIDEGKSTVTANVAITMAQAGKHTLLVDADLRRPTLHQSFELNNQMGLTTVLTSEADKLRLQEIVQEGPIPNLTLLTSGPLPPNPSELLSSKRMAILIDKLKTYYDMVILDLPPMLEVSDTQNLVHGLDGVVLVVRQNVTQKLAIKRVIDMLKISKAHLLGYVFNDVSVKNSGYGYGYSEKTKKS